MAATEIVSLKITTRGDFFLINMVSGKYWFGRIHADLWIHIKNFSEILNPKSNVNLYLMITFKIAIFSSITILATNLDTFPPFPFRKHNRFPNLKANGPLCLLLDRSDSKICVGEYFTLLLISYFTKLPPTYIVILDVLCRLYVINYSLKFCNFCEPHIAFIFCGVFAYALRPTWKSVFVVLASARSKFVDCIDLEKNLCEI